jgi:hypothetical protein
MGRVRIDLYSFIPMSRNPNLTCKRELSPLFFSRILYFKLFLNVFDLRIENEIVIKHNNKEFADEQYSKEINQ